MDWRGCWVNQYGSTVRITENDNDRIAGTFVTALEDSGFFGQEVAIVGAARGKCIAFSSVARGPTGDMVVSYTGLLRDGRLETLWHYAGDEALVAEHEGETAERREVPWWKAIIANADTFERVAQSG